MGNGKWVFSGDTDIEGSGKGKQNDVDASIAKARLHARDTNALTMRPRTMLLNGVGTTREISALAAG
jgi:hypothetical protein